MNTKNKSIKKERYVGTCSHYLARGALLWGPLYTTGVSGVVYAVAPSISADALSYSEVLLNSLIFCPSLGAAGGYIRWKLIKPDAGGEKGGKTPQGRPIIQRLKAGRKARYKKAA